VGENEGPCAVRTSLQDTCRTVPSGRRSVTWSPRRTVTTAPSRRAPLRNSTTSRGEDHGVCALAGVAARTAARIEWLRGDLIATSAERSTKVRARGGKPEPSMRQDTPDRWWPTQRWTRRSGAWCSFVVMVSASRPCVCWPGSVRNSGARPIRRRTGRRRFSGRSNAAPLDCAAASAIVDCPRTAHCSARHPFW
jgi:hypothetical protein